MRGEDSHHTVLKRDWSAAVTPPIFFLEFQQARERLRLFPEQPEGGQAAAVRKGCERGNIHERGNYFYYLWGWTLLFEEL